MTQRCCHFAVISVILGGKHGGQVQKTMLQLQQYLSNRGGDEQTDDGSSPKHMGVYISGNIMVAIV